VGSVQNRINIMTYYRYILEPYKGIATRHTCPACEQKRCFSRYIDSENKISFPSHVGRCDREEKCGYHFTPKQYFKENPERREEFTAYQSLLPQNHQPLKEKEDDSEIREENIADYQQIRK